MFHFLDKDRRKRRAVATVVMGTLSGLWIIGSVFGYCVLIASVFVHGRAGGQYYELLTHQLPTVSGIVSVWAVIMLPVATLAGFLFGWPYLHDNDYIRAVGYNLIPGVNLVALGLDNVF